MKKKAELLRSLFYYGLGTLGPRLISLLLFPILTFYIAKSELGLYDYIIILVSWSLPIFSLQIYFSSYRWLIESDEKSQNKKIITNSLLLVLCSSFLFSIFLYVLLVKIGSDWVIRDYIWEFIAIMFAVSYMNVIQQISRGLNKLKQFTLSGIINTVCVFLLSLIFIYYFTDKVQGLLLAYFIGNLVSVAYLFFSIKLWKYINIDSIEMSLLKKQITYSVPFIPNSMGLISVSFFNRYLVASFYSLSVVGIFALASKLSMIVYVVNSVFILAMQDKYIKEDSLDNDHETLNKFINFQLSVVLIILPTSPIVFKILVSYEYYEAWKYFPLLCLFSSYNTIASFLSIKYQKTKKAINLMVTTIISSFIGCVASWYLVGHGLYGLISGMIIGSFIYIYIVDKDLDYGGVKYRKIGLMFTLFLVEYVALIKYEVFYILLFLVFLLNVTIFFLLNSHLFKSFYYYLKARYNR